MAARKPLGPTPQGDLRSSRPGSTAQEREPHIDAILDWVAERLPMGESPEVIRAEIDRRTGRRG